ncbi:MAG: restriction endonuclease [Chloroflexi bacterium]|nr:restriction endonuclease [Chloroflexota bacterium]MBI3764515.1 restriction endonuclease [Chloroflexota bacterium]
MIIAGIYSFHGGQDAIRSRFSSELEETEQIIAAIDSSKHKTKVSKEKTMPGRKLYKPGALNKAFKAEFEARGWQRHKVLCEYPIQYYTPAYSTSTSSTKKTRRPRPFREVDFVKNRVGIEVQFGKYAFMVYNVCAKMTIFHNMGLIDVGIEIVPLKAFADEMATGVSYFEQFVWDLEHRGVANIDIPVLILGIAA